MQTRCNNDEQFNRPPEWSDVDEVLEIGEERYWLELYRGEMIDVMKYEPMPNPLGFDVLIAGAAETWTAMAGGEMPVWEAISRGELAIEGNLPEANRMHHALVRMCELSGKNPMVEVEG